MKKYLILFACVLALFVSCKKKVKPGSVEDIKQTYTQQPQMSTNSQDTAEVIYQVNRFINELKTGNTEGALSMLYYLNGDNIERIPKKLYPKLKLTLSAVSKCPEYNVEKLVFYKEKDCEVKINVTLFEKKESDPRPNTMSIMIKPVRRSGKWYLTLADSETDTNHGTEIKN